ncbi:hypothetical protein BZA05DRAFT_412305 [Tricharina praecox]|uniref:uncharacterized protein n=1 Tax=Tricharina praecox TaxID=43433 RepID=UPI00221F69DA|nr:uncharacterized protein BZA05DRAFT_412305 [Tricharina praecox]KAI5842307.1 hypothetical protein BZA05DRAFT_412305 [Tricharina praecox]
MPDWYGRRWSSFLISTAFAFSRSWLSTNPVPPYLLSAVERCMVVWCMVYLMGASFSHDLPTPIEDGRAIH